MPTFDVVSEVDSHELTNAVDQTNREISNRFDFKGSNARIERDNYQLTLHGESEFQLNQVMDILTKKMAKRGIDVDCLDPGKVEESGREARQIVTVRQGIDQDTARTIVKVVKEAKLKVQASIQGDKVRVTGKKKDDLQRVIATVKEAGAGLPLQYINFRD
jgi:uncharacterized protein YajQ (UPF0234 family)